MITIIIIIVILCAIFGSCNCESDPPPPPPPPDYSGLIANLRQKEQAIYARMENQKNLIIRTYNSEYEALQQEEARLHRKRQQLEEQAEHAKQVLEESMRAERIRSEQRAALRDFALKESPKMWASVQELRAELDDIDRRLDELYDAVNNVSQSRPEDDTAYLKLLKVRRERSIMLGELEKKIVAAFMASKKFETAQNRKLQSETDARVETDGMQTAEQLQSLFRSMESER